MDTAYIVNISVDTASKYTKGYVQLTSQTVKQNSMVRAKACVEGHMLYSDASYL